MKNPFRIFYQPTIIANEILSEENNEKYRYIALLIGIYIGYVIIISYLLEKSISGYITTLFLNLFFTGLFFTSIYGVGKAFKSKWTIVDLGLIFLLSNLIVMPYSLMYHFALPIYGVNNFLIGGAMLFSLGGVYLFVKAGAVIGKLSEGKVLGIFIIGTILAHWLSVGIRTGWGMVF